MQFCTRCLYSSLHPLNITFDDSGLCSGCQIHDEKELIDWEDRSKRLSSILNAYKNKSGTNYDCIVPVSGSGDSYFIVHLIKNVYGMNPLLVTYNKQYNTAVGVRNLANLRSKFNSDIMTLTVNPSVVKKITRATLRRIGSIYWQCIAGQTVYPVSMAVRLKIPLIIWGAHQGLDQVGMFSHFDEVEMTRKYRKEHDLMGLEAENLVDEFDEISEEDIAPYCYPDECQLEKIGVRGIYLGNYIRWDSRIQHEKMINLYGYETARQTRTFDTYSNVDCWNYSDLHDYIKWLKWGYGKVVDHASREIRFGRLDRNTALCLTQRYLSEEPVNTELFLKWIGMTKNSLKYILEQHLNKSMWSRNEEWDLEISKSLRHFVGEKYSSETPSKKDGFRDFMIANKKEGVDPNGQYILIGKGT